MTEEDAALLIRNSLREVLAEEALEINVDQSFTEDLNCDSLDLIELVMHVEDALDIEIPDNEIENFKTVRQAIDYVVGRTAPANA